MFVWPSQTIIRLATFFPLLASKNGHWYACFSVMQLNITKATPVITSDDTVRRKQLDGFIRKLFMES